MPGRGRGGDPDRIVRVVGEGAPDIVALQEVDAAGDGNQLKYLAEQLGMRAYGLSRLGANAFLSYFPIKGVREYDLGEGGCCLRGDVDVQGKRLHLFNVRLDSTPVLRRRQVASLLGPDLLGSASLGCPLLVLGDFADLFWGAGNFDLTMVLRKARRPLWSATYPARFPVSGRDRAYLRGDLRVVAADISRSPLARRASSHLPLVLTVQVTDPRTYLRVEKLATSQMKIAPG